MSDTVTSGFAAITSGVLSMLGAPHVPSTSWRAAVPRRFLGFPFDGANAAIERPGSANGPRGLRIASNMCFPWSFEWDIDLFEAYGLVDCGDAPLAIGNVMRTHELVQASSRRSCRRARSRSPSAATTRSASPVRAP